MAIELTVVSVYWRRWPSFIVQRVAENGAAVVPGDTVVQLYIVMLLDTIWFHFCVACEPVFILLCPVVPCVTLGLVVLPSGAVCYTGSCTEPFVTMEAFS